MHSCRRILFICTVQSLYYMRVYHKCFLTLACVCVGGLEVGFVSACSWLALVTGVGGYVLAGVEIGVLSSIFLYFLRVLGWWVCVCLYWPSTACIGQFSSVQSHLFLSLMGPGPLRCLSLTRLPVPQSIFLLRVYLNKKHDTTMHRPIHERVRPAPGLLTLGSRPQSRTSLVCSFAALSAFKSHVLLRNSIQPAGVGTTTTLLAVRTLPNNCRCVYSICQCSPACPPPAWL